MLWLLLRLCSFSGWFGKGAAFIIHKIKPNPSHPSYLKDVNTTKRESWMSNLYINCPTANSQNAEEDQCICMYVLFRSIQHQRGTIYTVWYDLKYVDQGAYLEVLRLLLSQWLSPGWPINIYWLIYSRPCLQDHPSHYTVVSKFFPWEKFNHNCIMYTTLHGCTPCTHYTELKTVTDNKTTCLETTIYDQCGDLSRQGLLHISHSIL